MIGRIIVIFGLSLGLIAGVMWALPQYSVWQQGLSGKAALKKAEETKLVLIEDAKARLEAAKLDAAAEVERAKGMAEAMKIENGQLTTTYNQYLFIRTLEEISEQGNLPQIIYVPAEGMIPVMDMNKYIEEK